MRRSQHRRSHDRGGGYHRKNEYVRYVNPLFPLQQGKKPNARDYLREVSQSCNHGIGYNLDWENGWRMRARFEMRFRRIIQFSDRLSRWLSAGYNRKIKK